MGFVLVCIIFFHHRSSKMANELRIFSSCKRIVRPQHQMIETLMNNEFVIIWKKVVVSLFGYYLSICLEAVVQVTSWGLKMQSETTHNTFYYPVHLWSPLTHKAAVSWGLWGSHLCDCVGRKHQSRQVVPQLRLKPGISQLQVQSESTAAPVIGTMCHGPDHSSNFDCHTNLKPHSFAYHGAVVYEFINRDNTIIIQIQLL